MRTVLLALLFLTAPQAGPSTTLRAGAAKVKITPDTPGWLTGYGGRKTVAEGVAQDLWARALAIEDANGRKHVLVTADILGFPPGLNRSIRADVRERYKLDDSQVMLVASHTHSGPAVTERPSMEIFHGLDDEQARTIFAYVEVLRRKVVDVIGEALANLKPARVSFGRTTAGFAMNRRLRRPDGSYSIADNREGYTDPDVPVLRVESENANLVALAFGYACHCTTLGPDTMKYHGDYAGVAAAELEKATPGAVALFVTGCGADINPSPRPARTFEFVDKHGQSLAKAVSDLPREKFSPVRGPLRGAYRVLDLPLDKPPSREILQKRLEDKNVYRQRHAREMLKLMDAGKLPTVVPLPLQVWKFGSDLTLVAIGGETCVEYALRLKRELGARRTWVAGYANEVPCYIPSEKVLAEGGYEAGWGLESGRAVADGSIMYYGWPVPLAPGLEAKIIEAVLGMARP